MDLTTWTAVVYPRKEVWVLHTHTAWSPVTPRRYMNKNTIQEKKKEKTCCKPRGWEIFIPKYEGTSAKPG